MFFYEQRCVQADLMGPLTLNCDFRLRKTVTICGFSKLYFPFYSLNTYLNDLCYQYITNRVPPSSFIKENE